MIVALSWQDAASFLVSVIKFHTALVGSSHFGDDLVFLHDTMDDTFKHGVHIKHF